MNVATFVKYSVFLMYGLPSALLLYTCLSCTDPSLSLKQGQSLDLQLQEMKLSVDFKLNSSIDQAINPSDDLYLRSSSDSFLSEDQAMLQPIIDQNIEQMRLDFSISALSDQGSLQDAGLMNCRPKPYPILFIHGFAGFSEVLGISYFFRVSEHLQERQIEHYMIKLSPFAHSLERAVELKSAIQQILDQTNACQVDLIAHSQGGIDSRIVIEDPMFASRIAHLITIASPHMGTRLADTASFLPSGLINPVGQMLAWLIGITDSQSVASLSDEQKATLSGSLESLSESYMANFNQIYTNTHNVPIYSVIGISNLRNPNNQDICANSLWGNDSCRDVIDPLLVASSLILGDLNDGIVPSAGGLYGQLLTCICADHFDQIGQIAKFTVSLVSRFDHIQFYDRLVDFLLAQ
jgi:triacylglycerol lipase